MNHLFAADFVKKYFSMAIRDEKSLVVKFCI